MRWLSPHFEGNLNTCIAKIIFCKAKWFEIFVKVSYLGGAVQTTRGVEYKAKKKKIVSQTRVHKYVDSTFAA